MVVVQYHTTGRYNQATTDDTSSSGDDHYRRLEKHLLVSHLTRHGDIRR